MPRFAINPRINHGLRLVFIGVASSLCWAQASFVIAQDPAEKLAEFSPDQSHLPAEPPTNAIILWDGKSINRLVGMDGGPINWKQSEGCLVSSATEGRVNHLVSTVHFRDADIHVEFMLPKTGSGNSGIYIHGNYELQIFNSFEKSNPDEHDGGSIYGFHKPLVNAMLPPEQWQVYDIRYIAPRRDSSGKIIQPGHITAFLNGKKVQDNAEFMEPRSTYHPFRYGTTPYLERIAKEHLVQSIGPVFLQDHDNPVQFRNVWIVPLDDQAAEYHPQK